MKMPARAARISATETASGTERPSAQGQATTSRATTRSSATAGPRCSHAAPVMTASTSSAWTKRRAARSVVRSRAGFLESASCTMASSAPTRVCAPAASTRTTSRAPRFVAPALHRVALPHGHRGGLAGQHGVVERRAAREDDAVDGDEFARADLDAVAGVERGQRDLDDRRVGAGPRELPRELEERGAAQAVGALEGRPLRAPLELPGAEQGRDEHRERVEPERPAAADDVPRARRERDGKRDRDGQVDVDDAGPEAGERRLEERARRVERGPGRRRPARTSGRTTRRARPSRSTRPRRAPRGGT